VSTGAGWNLVEDVRQMLSYPFMVNALRAGTIVAVVAGVIGYLMVVRRQAFVGHTLSLIGFPGAAGAAWLGVNAAFGYWAFCLAGALVIAILPAGGREASRAAASGAESAAVGTVQAMALASGFLFVSLYQGFLSGLTTLLFGSITGITADQVLVLLIAGIASLAVLAVIGRPLLFASVDPRVASARGIPVRVLSVAFLLVLGAATAGASQITGSLLVFALLVAPAATAARLTARPLLGTGLSVAIALAVFWLGAGIAFFSPYPIGFWVTTLAFGAFALASAYRMIADRLGGRVVHA
jgi:zinc/manganese transport system permease protein